MHTLWGKWAPPQERSLLASISYAGKYDNYICYIMLVYCFYFQFCVFTFNASILSKKLSLSVDEFQLETVIMFGLPHVQCGGLSFLLVSFLLHVKYTVSYRIVSYVSSFFFFAFPLNLISWKFNRSVCRYTCQKNSAENDGHEIAGHEIDGPSCRAWNCRTLKWRTKQQDMKMQDMKLTDQVAGHEIAAHENARHWDMKLTDQVAGHEIAA